MRLIDILNKIANGELKEGTKLKVFNYDFAKEYEYQLVFDNGELRTGNGSIFVCPCEDLNEECELIEPKHLPDVGKMSEPTDNTKIEELNVKGLCEIFEGKHTVNPNLAFSTALNKLNEVINKVNIHSTVLLAQEKDIKEIQEELDY